MDNKNTMAKINKKSEDYPILEQLVVIGNGFDLLCGLKSSYSNFFDHILELDKKESNFWYKIFQKLKETQYNLTNWTDIEARILEVLQILEFLYSEKLFREGENYPETFDLLEGIEMAQTTKMKYSIYDRNSIINTANIIIELGGEKVISLKDLHQLLKRDLLELERDFRDFLYNQINHASLNKDSAFQEEFEESETYSKYSIKSICLLSYLFRDYLYSQGLIDEFIEIIASIPSMNSFSDLINELGSFKSANIETQKLTVKSSIISFNYTSPFLDANIRNIHGDLDSNNIIFGIDYDKLNKNFTTPPIEFSKSYRILENGKNSSIELKSNLELIKFYGHGLGQADYSYFQSIFDTVDLYHGNTKLIFYWYPYNKSKKASIYKDQVEKVVSLIEEYGKTFTNRDHGRNLLTKLQLENRLIIKEIDETHFKNFL